jgi:hypothetical protein
MEETGVGKDYGEIGVQVQEALTSVGMPESISEVTGATMSAFSTVVGALTPEAPVRGLINLIWD